MKATILTASYNCRPYLKKLIRSVRNQTYKNWEMIIVDDKSADGSVSVLRLYARKDKRIRISQNKKHLGCGSTYAKALSLATGDICCVIDSDDALSHDKSLEKLMKQYRIHKKIDFIWTQFFLCDGQAKILKKGFSCLPPDGLSLLEAGVQGRHCFSHWRTFRTRLRDKGPIFREGLKAAVDKYMGYSLEELGRGAFFDKALYLYRQRQGGLTSNGRKQWKRMKKNFTAKREEKGIKPYPIIRI